MNVMLSCSITAVLANDVLPTEETLVVLMIFNNCNHNVSVVSELICCYLVFRLVLV